MCSSACLPGRNRGGNEAGDQVLWQRRSYNLARTFVASLPFFVFFFVLLLTILFGWIGRRDARQGAPRTSEEPTGVSVSGLLGLALLVVVAFVEVGS